MRRGRVALNVVTVLSGLLCAATAALWRQSFRQQISVSRANGTRWTLSSWYGHLTLDVSHFDGWDKRPPHHPLKLVKSPLPARSSVGPLPPPVVVGEARYVGRLGFQWSVFEPQHSAEFLRELTTYDSFVTPYLVAGRIRDYTGITSIPPDLLAPDPRGSLAAIAKADITAARRATAAAWDQTGYSLRAAAAPGFTIGVPHWLIVAVTVALPATRLIGGIKAYRRHRRLRERHAQGLCTACGYDLRETRERCPECGTPVLLPREEN
jgi:hypothetical protein